METIKMLANKLGIQASTIRYYEQCGLIAFKRDDNGYRVFDNYDLQQLKLILIMKYSDYSIQEIKDVMGMMGGDMTADCEMMTYQVIQSKRDDIIRKIENYQKILKISDFLLPQTHVLSDDTNQAFGNIINNVFETIKEDTL